MFFVPSPVVAPLVAALLITTAGCASTVADAPSSPPEPASGQATAPSPGSAPPAVERESMMTLERLDAVIRAMAVDAQRSGGSWTFSLGPVQLLCITDVNADRMRIVAPIATLTDVSPSQRDAMLEANFHTALDARYATTSGTLFSVFVHPLSPLTAAQLRSGIVQTAQLALTFGTSYSSGGLSFGAGASEAPGSEL